MKKFKLLQNSIPGKIITALVYLIMAALVLMFFTGNGAFIYEAF